MEFNVRQVRRYLEAFDLPTLFVEELGWDAYDATLPVVVEDRVYTLRGIAEKRGVQIFACNAETIPDYRTRRKLERHLTDLAFEHLLIFTDTDKTTQIWQWVDRQPGKPAAYREHSYYKGHAADALIQRLRGITFTLSEEEGLSITAVASRLRDQFDKEPVTKKFYERFKKEHDAFLELVEGIHAQDDREWYVSVMLNRLMFVYFIQQKGLLDGDIRYLQNRLERVRQEQGKDRFHSFYRHFLLRLFHEGLGSSARHPGLDALLGRVPYLNGGLFDKHLIEEHYGAIHIPDKAFECIFAFFDEFRWHLDERPMREQNEINPDVLGYIFEKYINQKQMGAYYTKEDITEYISQNTILPYLLDSARKHCRIAFEGEQSVWKLLHQDPDRYIYAAVRHGADLPLPPEIAAGIADVAKRSTWNTPAPADYALPTEIWREVVARRQRYEEVKTKLHNGEVTTTSDLITLNLYIRQFTQDVIETCEGPELLRAIWKALEGVTVLDPTCGSGAFLFAALNILQPLYEACLTRMEGFVSDYDRNPPALSGTPFIKGGRGDQKFSDFRKVLERVAKHPNRGYFILKAIILNNLYGVDIMAEAVEIAKLRLFLKLVAQVEEVRHLDPLPDIDFNIRAGNTLVGYASYDEVQQAVEGKWGKNELVKLDLFNAMDAIREKAQAIDRLYRLFRQQQTELGGEVTPEDKQELRRRLQELEDELNVHLAREYGVNVEKKAEFEAWRKSHQPFHWFTEFYGIMSGGGFDVIIGNPPWKEYSSVRKTYRLHNYTTLSSGNLYGICTERCLSLSSPSGYFSFVVQLPLVSSSRMISVRKVLRDKASFLAVIPFDDRPGKLFNGLEHCRSTIFVCKTDRNRHAARLYTTRYQRWTTETRNLVFAALKFVAVSENSQIHPELFPKQGDEPLEHIFCKVRSVGKSKIADFVSQATTKHFIFYQEAMQYWAKATVGLPYYAKNGVVGAPAHGRYLYFDDEVTAYCVGAILNSSLFYLYFLAYSDGFHLSQGVVSDFPVGEQILRDDTLAQLGRKLMIDLTQNADTKTISTKVGDSISYAQFYGSKSKPVMDEIDRVLAKHYGFTDEELDFIINYDIKYRLGDSLFEGEDG